MPAWLRNKETGAIKTADPESREFADLVHERTEDDRFPLYEQTGAHDADPENHASAEEVQSRSRWGVKNLSDVTADGVGQSQASEVHESRTDTLAREQRRAADEGKTAKAASK